MGLQASHVNHEIFEEVKSLLSAAMQAARNDGRVHEASEFANGYLQHFSSHTLVNEQLLGHIDIRRDRDERESPLNLVPAEPSSSKSSDLRYVPLIEARDLFHPLLYQGGKTAKRSNGQRQYLRGLV